MKVYLIFKLTLGIWIDDGIAFDSHAECSKYANQLRDAGLITICEPRSE